MKEKDALKVNMGRRFRDAREARGWTRERLAEEAGLSVPFLADFELGNTGIRLDRFRFLCQLLNVDAQYALFGDIKGSAAVQRIENLIESLDEFDLRRLEAIVVAYVDNTI